MSVHNPVAMALNEASLAIEGTGHDELVALLELAANHINTQNVALGNCLMLAMRRSRASHIDFIHWQHIIRFCKDAGVEPSPLRSEATP